MEFEFYLNSCNTHIMKRYFCDNRKKVFIDFTSNSKNLYIFLGGIRQGKHSGMGIPLFEFFNISENLQCKKVFIRDMKQAWYHHGLDVEGIKNIVQLANYIKGLIESSKAENIFLVGNSMGGYAALLLGKLMAIKAKVIVFNPQTFIGAANFSYYKEDRWLDKMSNLPEGLTNDYLDLKLFFEDNNVTNDVEYHIHFSSIDRFHAMRMAECEGYYFHDYSDTANHELVKYLRDTGLLLDVLKG